MARRISSFPECDDMLSEIFKRLPLDSVVLCRRVRKSWYSLIKTRDFQILHFNYQKTTQEYINNHIIFQDFDSDTLFSVGFDNNNIKEIHIPQFSKDIPPPNYWELCRTSSYGLICFFGSFTKDIYIWNPAIKKFKSVPPSLDHLALFKRSLLSKFRVAFGYSSKLHDFNVVKILMYRGCRKLECSEWNSNKGVCAKWLGVVDVYSLSSNSWKSLQLKDDYVIKIFHHNSCFALINGVVYCWNEERVRGMKKIMGFNIENEKFREIVLPRECREKHFVIEAFGELVSLLVRYQNPNIVEMWVLDEDEENGVWKKKISVNLDGLYTWPPLGFRSNGELVLKTFKWKFQLDSFNVETGKKTKLFNLNYSPGFNSYFEKGDEFEQIVFMDSLFSILGV